MIGRVGSFSATGEMSLKFTRRRDSSTGVLVTLASFSLSPSSSRKPLYNHKMADLATPSAATMSTIDAGATKPASTKPERPDQADYDKTLAEAQKALDAAVERQASPAIEC